MTDAELERLRYPVGKFIKPVRFTREFINSSISTIQEFPDRLKAEVKPLSDAQLDTRYRPGGWTIRQVVHHVADSHLNSYTRFKLALTEEQPTIRTYFEDRWAELVDARTMPVDVSLQLLTGLHARWTLLMKSFSEQDLRRELVHPEREQRITLDEYIGEYAWHSRHHLAHITATKKVHGW